MLQCDAVHCYAYVAASVAHCYAYVAAGVARSCVCVCSAYLQSRDDAKITREVMRTAHIIVLVSSRIDATQWANLYSGGSVSNMARRLQKFDSGKYCT